METAFLSNGLRFVYMHRPCKSVAVHVNVRSGSDDEDAGNRGISHFLEHLVFDGTQTRKDSFAVSNEIESVGGELNAATTNDRTFFYAKVLDRHFGLAVDILSDILLRPTLSEENIAKERAIVADEIKMVNDQPRYYQWVLFQKALFRGHPARFPVYGNIRSIQAMGRQKVISYYRKHYVPANMTVTVVGNVQNAMAEVEKWFGRAAGNSQATNLPINLSLPDEKNMQNEKRLLHEKRLLQNASGNRRILVKKRTLQSYMVLGYRTAGRAHPDSYAFDIIRAILGRGQSGRIFDEIRTRLGLAYDVGVLHNPCSDFGYIAVYAGTNRKNVRKIEGLIECEFRKLLSVSDRQLAEAKTFLEGEFLMQAEDNYRMADLVAAWDQAKDPRLALSYVNMIRKVTKKDIAKAVSRYCRHHTVALIC